MDREELVVGSVIVLKKKYLASGKVGLILEIQESSLPGNQGWISMNYVVMMSTGEVLNISESCIEQVIG
jgi:hypothetical protein